MSLGRYLSNHKIPLPLASFPASFTSWNFIDIEFLISKMIDFQKESIGQVEADISHLKDQDSKTRVEQFLHQKRQTLKDLQELGQAACTTASSTS